MRITFSSAAHADGSHVPKPSHVHGSVLSCGGWAPGSNQETPLSPRETAVRRRFEQGERLIAGRWTKKSDRCGIDKDDNKHVKNGETLG